MTPSRPTTTSSLRSRRSPTPSQTASSPNTRRNSSDARMHELFLWGLPLLGAPLWAARQWLVGRRVMASTGIAIGERLESPGTYPAAQGGHVNLGKTDARAHVLAFMSNRCPGVKAYDSRLKQLASRFGPQGVKFVGINSAPEALYPREGLEGMRKAAQDRGLVFPYLKDSSQALMGR